MRFTAQILLFLLLVASVALILNALSFRQRLSDVHIAQSDNLGWVIAQLEVDHQGLMLALTKPEADDFMNGDLAARTKRLELVRREFDILYSRIGIFEATVDRLFTSGENDMRMQAETLLGVRDDLASKLDAIEEPNAKAMLEFARNVYSAYPTVRGITTKALEETVDMATRSREAEAAQYQRFLVQSVFLVVLMWAGILLVVRLWRELEKRSKEATRVATTLTNAFNSTLNGVIVTDARFNVIYCNRVILNLLGYQPSELDGRPLSEFVPLDQILSPKQRMFSWALSDGVTVGGDGGPAKRGTCYRKDGRECQVEISLASELSSSGHEIVIIFIRDISDRIAAERKQKAALIEAEKAGRAKSQFLATMSHEMRTPLHGLIASLDLIDTTAFDSSSKKLFETARDCSARILMQVNDVLELTRLGEKKEAVSRFRPDLIAFDIVQELRPLAEKANNVLAFECQGDFDNTVLYGLPIAFSRALYNLVGNALKFTHCGNICVSLRVFSTEDGPPHLRVEVRDTGIGISENDRDRIFESFETAAPSELNHATGTGLGLAIVRLAIEEQGGTLDLESELGVGSCFSFEVPVSERFTAEQRSDELIGSSVLAVSGASTQFGDTSTKHVLIADDHEVNRSLVAMMVTRLGHTFDMAQDGAEAVAKAYDTFYDVILMDFSMPRMDGPAATDVIRNGDGACRDVPIVGMTALIEPYTIGLKSPQMTSVLTKPFSLSGLDRELRGVGQSENAKIFSDEADIELGYGQGCEEIYASLCEELGCDRASEFLKSVLDDVEQALVAAQAQDEAFGARAETVHRAVGSAAVLGLVQISDVLADIEVALREKKPPCTLDLVTNLERLRHDCYVMSRGRLGSR